MSQKLDGKVRPKISKDITALCTLSIVDFYRQTKKYTETGTKIPDEDYRYIGTWGIDRYSKMQEEELSKLIAPNVLSYIKKKTSHNIRLDAFRWVLRGLSPYDAVRKVKADRK